MNYRELLSIIAQTALTHKYVDSFDEGDVYDILNSGNNKIYSKFIVTPQQHNLSISTPVYNFWFYYVDRLTVDETNRVDIHTKAMKVVQDLVTKLNVDYADYLIVDETTLNTELFTEKFSDLCACIFCTISIKVFPSESDTCNELFETVVDPILTWIDEQIQIVKENYPTLVDSASEVFIRTILQPSFNNSSPTNLYNTYYGTENDPTIIITGTIDNINIQYS